MSYTIERDLLENYFSIEGGNEIHLDIKKINQNAKVPAKYFIECYGMLDDDEKNYPLERILSNLARKYVQSIIEDHLDYRLKIQRNKELRDIKPLSLLFIKVDGLIGALWLQFYQYATNLSKFGYCKTCGDWFLQSDQRVVTRKEFCSNKCKMTRARGLVNKKKSGLASLAESAVASDLLKKVISGKVALQFAPQRIQKKLNKGIND